MKRIIIILSLLLSSAGCSIAGAELIESLILTDYSALYRCSLKGASDQSFSIFVSYQDDSGEVTAWDFWLLLEVESQAAPALIEIISENSIFLEDYAGVNTYIGFSDDQEKLIMKYTFVLAELDYEALAKSPDLYAKMVVATAGYNSGAILRLLENTGYSCQHAELENLIKMTTIIE